MNQLYLLNLNRVLATRYKIYKSLSLFLSFFSLRADVYARWGYESLLESFSASSNQICYLFLDVLYPIFCLYLCVFLSFFIFFLCCVYFLNWQNNNVCVCHCVVMFYFFFFFFFCSLRVLYSSSHNMLVCLSLIFFLCYFCSDKRLMMIN